jgi:hypothetical protein
VTSYSTRCQGAYVGWGQNLFRTFADQHFIGVAGGFGERRIDVFEHKAAIPPNVEDKQIVRRVFEEVREVGRDGLHFEPAEMSVERRRVGGNPRRTERHLPCGMVISIHPWAFPAERARSIGLNTKSPRRYAAT